jgi:hypothetical protein
MGESAGSFRLWLNFVFCFAGGDGPVQPQLRRLFFRFRARPGRGLIVGEDNGAAGAAQRLLHISRIPKRHACPLLCL